MNEEHRTIDGIRIRNVALEKEVSALDVPPPKPALMLGRTVHPNLKMSIGLAGFWFGRKNNCRRSP
jgi:hypothetical protein